MKRAILGMALVAGCGGPFDAEAYLAAEAWREIPAPLHAEEAKAAVTSFYGTVGTPDVHWYGGAGLTGCPDPGVVGWAVTGSSPPHCVGGQQIDRVIIVADAPEWMLLHDTSLAHELAHMRSWEATGDSDGGHRSHYYAPGGEVDQANDMLARLGY